MMKKLTLLLNEPNGSKEVIVYAVLLAEDLNATVQILHIQNPQGYGTHESMGTAVAQAHENLQKNSETAKKTVDEYILEIRNEISSAPTIEFKSEIGIATGILEDKVANGEIDMLMMQGQSEKAFWAQTISNMEIIRNVQCPIWIIAPDTKYQALNKIIYATDYKEADVTTLNRVIDLTRPFLSEITALHISEKDLFVEEVKAAGLDEVLKQKTNFNNIRAKMVINKEDRDLIEILNEEADRTNANLIVVLKENRNFFEAIFKSSFTSKLIRNAQLPVLVFHEKR